jgi:hypothetical protein
LAALAEKLVRVREDRGWTIHAATKNMEGVHNQTLWTLEGRNPHREPAPGGEMKLKTAIAIASAYYPDITLQDLMGNVRCLLRLSPKNTHSRRVLRKYRPQVPPSPPPSRDRAIPDGGAVA